MSIMEQPEPECRAAESGQAKIPAKDLTQLDLDTITQNLRRRAEQLTGKQSGQLRSIIRRLKPVLTEARKQGATYEMLAAWLKAEGIPISLSALKLYLKEAHAEKKRKVQTQNHSTHRATFDQPSSTVNQALVLAGESNPPARSGNDQASAKEVLQTNINLNQPGRASRPQSSAWELRKKGTY